MTGLNLVESFSEFKELKNINKEKLQIVLEDVFRTLIRKKFGADDNFDIIINSERGDLEIWRNREIVEDDEFEDEITEIPLSEALKIEEDFEVGEEVSDKIELAAFGRRNVASIKQNLYSRILELEKDEVFNYYSEKIGELVVAEVFKTSKREILLTDEEGNELVLPKTEQIPSDYFKPDTTVKAVVAKVDMRGANVRVILSRTAPEFLERLFEQEIPEVMDGLITIKKIVREPGERAKVAVESYDDRIDPVGACVGMKGSRIHGIVRELRNENIDVINYTNNAKLYISRSLSPAKISQTNLDEEKLSAEVFLPSDQVSLAIGKGGHNIRLASKLTGYKIDVYRDDIDEEDVDLTEFTDEIDEWIIEALKSIGCDTAKDVLKLSKNELERRTDLEVETIEDVISILEAEFK